MKYCLFLLLILSGTVIPQEKPFPDGGEFPPSAYDSTISIQTVNSPEAERDSLNKLIPGNVYDTIISDTAGYAQDSIPEGLTSRKIIENYINAIGGEKQLYNIADRTTVIHGLVQGINITIISYQKMPDKKKQVVKAGSVEQQIIFDGENGIMKLGDKTENIEGTELEKLKFESTMLLLTELDHYGVKLSLPGIDSINGRAVYSITMTLPSGIKWTHYYDKETFLKVKESKYIKTPAGLFEQETFFDDYREVEGIKYPFLLIQKMGNQNMEFIVTSVKVNTGLIDREFEIR